ncbi:MAG: hypothetical protein MUP81_03685 [Dehalococcoidia bacterium]|nr:hypothetical protein [Dehalococcoidia bacterium]
MQVEAQKLFAEDSEKVIIPFVKDFILNQIPAEALPPAFKNFLAEITSGQSFAVAPFLLGLSTDLADNIFNNLTGAALQDYNYWLNSFFHDKRITAGEASLLRYRNSIDLPLWGARMLSGGYDTGEAALAYGANLPYPAVSDIMLYCRYMSGGRLNRGDVWAWAKVPEDEIELWEFMTQQRLTAMDAHTMLRRKLFTQSEYNRELACIGYVDADSDLMQEIGWSIPNAMLLVQGDLMQGLNTAAILADISIADIHPDYANKYLDAILTKPATEDIIAYLLRKDPELSNLSRELTKIGIHPDYLDFYRELAYPIPPVADIITMAVREAFTPSIAARFGQYEDLPSAYVENCQKKGLSKEWAERYWAAHWSLPSPQQGFEMLHRGIINREELSLLLRALDIMPFWRDRLIQMSYEPLTRVDVRRMYAEGVISEGEVLQCYLDIGYDDKNARRLTEFTIKQTLTSQSKFTSADVVTAYTKYMIDAGEARSLLSELGVKSENISFIMKTADYQREWALTDAKIDAIKNLYKKGTYDDNKARSELLRLGIATAQVDVLLEQWYIIEKDKAARTWTTADTLKFAKAGLISRQRAIGELRIIGYDEEHISIYLQGLA